MFFNLQMSKFSSCQRNAHSRRSKPLILPSLAYRAAGGVTHCQSVLAYHIIQLVCNLQVREV